MFINSDDIVGKTVVDVRSKEEFEDTGCFNINIPIIDKRSHDRLKKFYPSAPIFILWGLYINRKNIEKELLRVSNNGNKPIVVCCSRGRLRSPIMCLYARSLGIDTVVLKKGVKGYMRKLDKSMSIDPK